MLQAFLQLLLNYMIGFNRIIGNSLVKNSIKTYGQILRDSLITNHGKKAPTTTITYNFSLQKIKLSPKLSPYIRLMRWDKPIGAMLLYWPTAWGVCLGSPGMAYPSLLLLFLMGSWAARSAGCIVNDYLDRDFDRKVERTRLRPLASGEVTVREAGWLLFANLSGGLIVLLNMNMPAVITALGFVALGGLYPLAKRYTNYPQLVLGMAFNSGIIIGALTANPAALTLVPAIWPMYISGIAWTLIYDTVYAYQDLEDDLKIGVKSTAVTWHNKNPKQIMERFAYVMLVCHLGLPFLDADFCYSTPIMTVCDLLLIREIRQLDLKNGVECGNFFKKNNMYGLAVFVALLIYGFTKSYRQYCDKNAGAVTENTETK